MDRTELIYFVVLTFIILFAPFFPTSVLLLLDHILFRLAAVVLLLYLISIGPTAGIFGLIVVCVLYLERNRRKVAVAVKKLDRMDVYRPAQATVEEVGTPQKTVPVNSFATPNNEESPMYPKIMVVQMTCLNRLLRRSIKRRYSPPFTLFRQMPLNQVPPPQIYMKNSDLAMWTAYIRWEIHKLE